MKRNHTFYKYYLIHMMAVILFAAIGTILSAAPALAAENRESQADISIAGRLLDEEGTPLVQQELRFRFYTGSATKEVEQTVTTDGEGFLLLNTAISQRVYENPRYRYVEIRGRILFAGETEAVEYQPGEPGAMDQEGDEELWAAAGVYTEDEIQLFYSLRRQNADGGGEENEGSEFPALSITLGTVENPCVFRLRRTDEEKDEARLVVKHIGASAGEPLAEEEIHVIETPQPAEIATVSRPIEGMAPISVELSGAQVEEAAKENPITGYLLKGPWESGITELIYYYHPDRDGDGVPDHRIVEAYVTPSGQTVPGYEERTALYAHREQYQAQVLPVQGYIYEGYQRDDEPLLTGIPEAEITADVEYRYVYSKKDSGGSDGGGTKDPPPEPPDPEEPGIPPDPPVEPGFPEEPEPPPEPDEKPEPPEEPDEENPEDPQADPDPRETMEGGPPGSTSSLAEKEEPQRRSVTFIKFSYRQHAEPGEEITYGFRGFGNTFLHPLQAFTIIDQPDPGLDFVSIQLPAFRRGEGLTYDISYTTNQSDRQILVGGYPASQPQSVRAPVLEEQEYITALYIELPEVPPGFGTGDEIQMVFKIWEDPPEDQLHNLGALFYKENGKAIELYSDEGSSLVEVGVGAAKKAGAAGSVRGRPRKEHDQSGFLNGGNKGLSDMWEPILAASILSGVAAGMWKKKERRNHR